MEQLIEKLKQLLADNVTLTFKSQGYHWNVEGNDFSQYHKFFGKIYEDFGDATDTYAEWLRILNTYSPYRVADFFDLSTIGEPVIVGKPEAMLVDLYNEMEKHIKDLKEAGGLANAARENGLMDFLAARQTAAQKFCWMLRSSIESEESGMEDMN